MRLRHWLLMGTSLGFMAAAPLSVSAQDIGALYDDFVNASSSGDADAQAAARAALEAACADAGFESVDDCIALLSGGAPAPAEDAAPPAEDVAPPAGDEAPVVEEPAPDEAPVADAPAEEMTPEPEAAPVEDQAPVDDQVAPLEEQPAVEEQAAPVDEPVAPVEDEAPVADEPAQMQDEVVQDQPVPEEPAPAEQAAPIEDQAPMAEEPAAEEPAPAQQPAAAEDQAAAPADQAPAPVEEPAPAQDQAPVAEQPAPAEDQAPAAQPAPANGNANVSGALSSAVADYEAAVEALTAAQANGGDTSQPNAAIDAAYARIEEACTIGGYTSVDECLADNGITLTSVPDAPATPAGEANPPAAGEAPMTDENAAPTPQMQEELANDPALEGQPTEAVDLPSGVAEEDVAPLLDSAKDEENLVESGEAPPEDSAPAGNNAPAAPEPAPADNAPPPANDQAAQADITPQQIQSLEAEQGERMQQAPALQAPQNVTIVNQTNTTNTNTTNNNTINNNTTNNTNNVNTVVTNNTVDNAVVFQFGNQLVISNPAQDQARIALQGDEVYYEQLSGGRVRETVVRPDGTRVVTVRNAFGDILRRSRITPDGREYILAYASEEDPDEGLFYRDPAQGLPPLRLTISASEYVLDAEVADESDVVTFFRQPPVEQVRRIYTIEEVKRSARIRDTVRRLEVGGLTFDSGAATISRDQVGALNTVAAAMQQLLMSNPAETFLIEGHTDAVGSDISNLELSDRRAATVARILTDFYDIPPENLVTQGYGERYLKIRTEASERENRRVTIRRITALVTPVVASN